MPQALLFPKFKALNHAGQPLSGGKVYTYLQGTTTDKATYPTSANALAGTSANTNPVVLDANGEAAIHFVGRIKVKLTDSSDVTQWTVDNIEGAGIGYMSEYRLSDYASLTAAATALNALGTDCSLVLDTDDTMTGAITFDLEVTVVPMPGNVITTAGNAITFNGPFKGADHYEQVFSGTGAVTFASGSVGFARPEWWGVDGTADQVQINYANDSVSAGTVVQLLDKTYSTTAAITLSSGVTLKGMGSKVTKIVPAATISNIITTDASATDVRVEDLWVYGTGTTSTTERGFYPNACTDITVQNCKFGNMTYGVHLYDTDRATITKNLFDGIVGLGGQSEGYAILASTDCTKVSVVDNKFQDIARHAIYFSSGATDCSAIGNIINHVGESAIAVYATSVQNKCSHTIVGYNTIVNVDSDGDGDDGHGIELTDYCYDNLIVGNFLEDINDMGILLQAAASANATVKPTRSHIADNIISGAGDDGIRIMNADDTDVVNNQIYNSTANGIVVSNSGSNLSSYIKRCLIDGNTIRTAGTDGIAIGCDATFGEDITLGANKISDISGTNIIQAYGLVNTENKASPVWVEDVITYADFTAAAVTDTENFTFVVPAGCIITGIWWKVDTLFDAPAASALVMRIGVSGGDTDGFIPDQDVLLGSGSTGYQDSAVTSWGDLLYDSVNKQTLQYFCAAATTVLVTLTITDDTCDNLTVGQARIFIRYEQVILPTT